MTAILSFLGSAVFRWALEKIFGLVEKKQEHGQELEMMQVQERIASTAHARNMDLLTKQSELKLAEVELAHRGAVELGDIAAFQESLATAKPSGVGWVDGWSGAIRPFVASVCVLAWIGLLVWAAPATLAAMTSTEKAALGAMVIEFTLSLVGATIGWFFGSRSLMPGKK